MRNKYFLFIILPSRCGSLVGSGFLTSIRRSGTFSGWLAPRMSPAGKVLLEIWFFQGSNHYCVKFLHLVMPRGLDFLQIMVPSLLMAWFCQHVSSVKQRRLPKLSDLLLHLSFVSTKSPLAGVRVNQRIVHLLLRTLPLTLVCIFELSTLNLPEKLWIIGTVSTCLGQKLGHVLETLQRVTSMAPVTTNFFAHFIQKVGPLHTKLLGRRCFRHSVEEAYTAKRPGVSQLALSQWGSRTSVPWRGQGPPHRRTQSSGL